jgi:hypothetical protein
MGTYEGYLRALLAPLNVYDLAEGTVNGAELCALGAALDAVSGALEYGEREALVATAETEGLSRREDLFARRPAAPTTALRRSAIAALENIDGDSLTPSAINAAIAGCGIRARAQELGGGRLRIVFPEVAGEPEGAEQIQRIILDIIPCHLETQFYFRYLTWAECEAQTMTWADAESAGWDWDAFQLAVPPEA